MEQDHAPAWRCGCGRRAGAAVRFVKQVAPDDRGPHRPPHRVRRLRGDYPLGAWGAESRDYHVCVELVPRRGRRGRERLAARVSVVRGDEVLGKGDVLAEWTDDTALSTRISRGSRTTPGRPSWPTRSRRASPRSEAGDVRTATARLGRAVELAGERPGNDAPRSCWPGSSTSTAATGTVRLRAEASKAARMTLDSRSTVTVRVRGQGLGGADLPGGPRVRHRRLLRRVRRAPDPSAPRHPRPACPVCREALEDGARFCEVCGHDSTKPQRPRPPRGRWSPPRTGRGSRRSAAAKAPTSRR